jgi:hypothetical protein
LKGDTAFSLSAFNAGDILPDGSGLPRGIAVNVLNVEGDRLPGGTARDFVMVNGRAFQAKVAEKFLSSLKILAKTTDRLEGTKKVGSAALRGLRDVFEAVGATPRAAALGGAPNVEPPGENY